MTGSYLNGSSVYINDEKKEPLLINDNTIIINNCSNYINKKVRVKIIKGDSVLEKETMFLKETSYENTAVGSNDPYPIEYPIISNGNELFIFLIDYVAIGVVPDNPNEPIVWNCDTAQIDYSLYSNCDRKTIINHYDELRDKMAYYNGNFVVGIPDYSDNHLLTVLAYSPENNLWYKVSEISDQSADLSDCKIFVYNGNLYCGLIGERKEWRLNSTLSPSNNNMEFNRSYEILDYLNFLNPTKDSVFFQVGDKLLLYDVKKDMCNPPNSECTYCFFENGMWRRNMHQITPLNDTPLYFCPVKEGLLCFGTAIQGFGNTFIYDMNDDIYNTDYMLPADDLYKYGTIDSFFTAKDSFYCVSTLSDYFSNGVFYKSIPIESPYVKVQATPVDGLTVYGEKYYQAGDLVTLRFRADNNLDNLKILVNNDVACYSSATGTYEYTAIANELADGVKIEIQPEAEISIDGFQISTKNEGLRTLYHVSDTGNTVVESGLLYGICGYSPAYDMVIESTNHYVHSFKSTDNGLLPSSSKSDSYRNYAMTMTNIKSCDYYRTDIMVRAYAKTDTGECYYSDIVIVSVNEIADFLYSNIRMPSKEDHDYLYNNILIECDPNYQPIDYNK